MNKLEDALNKIIAEYENLSDDTAWNMKELALEALSEVRRLRAMLEPTPDARGLAQLIFSHFRASMNQVSCTPGANPELDGAAQLIAAHDARLLDEAAERACAFIDANVEAYNYDYRAFRAAIKGVAHE